LTAYLASYLAVTVSDTLAEQFGHQTEWNAGPITFFLFFNGLVNKMATI
jgi:hypothetical protein